MFDRRHEARQKIDLFLNKYVDGHPYLCRARDISRTGLRVTAVHEPESSAVSSTLELRLPGDEKTLWVWAEQVWRRGKERALHFVALHDRDQERLDAWIAAQ
ncbi:MAG TPA: PilZ domain-containing protein [Polyangiaceae bacterium]|nr:PilZ domain-containing protein [Polyangiaceae bacterium]